MKLPLEKINEEIKVISNSIDQNEWADALFRCEIILRELDKHNTNNVVLQLYFNIASQFIDAGTYLKNIDSILKGIQILEKYSEHFEKNFNITYFYNLANGKLSIANNCGYSKEEVSFKNIELFNEVKNLYWKAFKLINKSQDYDLYQQNLINLANVLKQQFRFSEALQLYNLVIKQNTIYPQAWLNKSSCLEQFDRLLDHTSQKMIIEIIKGYDFACESKLIPNDWKPYYLHKSKFLSSQLDSKSLEQDELETHKEYSSMSHFRQWCIEENLTLNIHGMYCHCIANERDTLTLFEDVISSDNILNYEQYLNRIKAEFSLVRILYYESKYTDNSKIDYESCYSELHEQEIINNGSEKLRTCFRLCFSILDKLAIFLCQYFSLSTDKNTAFNNFWYKNKSCLENKTNFGLIAINSLICDLNEKKWPIWIL